MTTSAATLPQPARPVWRRLIGFNLLTAVLLGVGGYYLGWFIGHQIGGPSYKYQSEADENDVALLLAYTLGVIGFLIGLGFANYPLSRLLGRPASLREKEGEGISRYFGLCTDHKVVGIQYLVGIGVFIFIGGVNAMLIRTELLHQQPTVVGPNQYLTLVGMHGTMMMGMMTSGILGPFANYFVPIMIGARRMAFPRIEALTFWLLMAAGFILVSTIFFGGFPTGWTGYEPLNDQAVLGMDSYILFFALVGISMTLLGLNMLVTIMALRAPGLTWSRLPIFVWAVFGTAILMVLAAPTLVATLLMSALDRTINTSFFINAGGGSAYLYENLFWFFGHPEVYILALPGFGVVLEMLPVFTRKPLWGYRLAISGMLGVTLMSFFVWQHHLFVSGINADLRPFYMLSTEIISIPTGFIFLCVLGTLWKARISFTVPMLFVLAWTFNFLIGGLSGVFLSDVTRRHHASRQLLLDGPLPLHDHGRAGLRLLRCDLLLGAEDDRPQVQRAARQMAFLADVPGLQLDLHAAVRRRPGGPAQARERIRAAPARAQRVGFGVRVRARVLDAHLHLQRGLLDDLRTRARGGEPVALEVDRVAVADTGAGAQLRRDPRVRLRPLPLRNAGADPRRAAGLGGCLRWPPKAQSDPAR